MVKRPAEADEVEGHRLGMSDWVLGFRAMARVRDRGNVSACVCECVCV